MTGHELTSLVIAGFAAALLHASLPTHWLPFVLAARAHGWSIGKTLMVNLAAGGGHVVFTAFLGLLIVLAGAALPEHLESWASWVGGVALIALGFFALWRDRQGRDPHILGHHHDAQCHHELPGLGKEPGASHVHAHARDGIEPGAGSVALSVETPVPARGLSQGLTIAGLFALVSLSPCEAFLPIYMAGAAYGWTGFAVLTVVLIAGTIGGMLLLTWLTFHSAERMKIHILEEHEGVILGVALIALGVFVLTLTH